MSRAGDIVVLGIGRSDRGDDGIGPALAAAYARSHPSRARVKVGARDAAWILDAWSECDGAIVLDCIRSGRPPGTVHRLDPSLETFVDGANGSTHGLGVASAVELGRVLGALPPRLALVGIEGARFDLGASLSPEVRQAMPRALATIEEVLREWGGEASREECGA